MKDVRFIWCLPQEDSFMKLKELITSAPVLVLPNDDLPFRPFRRECKGNLTDLRRILHLSLAKENPK
jgi:hypothetical protein